MSWPGSVRSIDNPKALFYRILVTHVVRVIQDVSGIVYVRVVFAVYLNVMVAGGPVLTVVELVVVISKQSVVKKDTGSVDVQNGTVEEYTLPPIVIELVYLHAGVLLNLKALKAKAPPTTARRAIRERKSLAVFMVFFQKYCNSLCIQLVLKKNS
ncbi:hypothetical protein L3C95_27235 [Chitinophaga filiformis]|uniref:hypothetical protein n=1 Tax=Chitinophaga filiformis TaxID=104663 RepID=UPI001F240F81|nr:hypothetical protein [Chitinophaga filiformis]MCF6406622.1 hypothetical protein [Chitinophaga filiformis]